MSLFRVQTVRQQKHVLDVLLNRVLVSDIWPKGSGMLKVALADFTRNNCHYMAAGIAVFSAVKEGRKSHLAHR